MFGHLSEAFGFFYGVEVLPLHVFYYGDEHVLFIAEFSYKTRNLIQSGFDGSSPPAFTCNDLVSSGFLSDHYRLDYSVLPDGCSQFFKLFFVKDLSWLVGIWGYVMYFYIYY